MDMSKLDSFGLRVFRNGVEYHSDRRRSVKTRFVGEIIQPVYRPPGGYRGKIRAFSFESVKRLRWVFANACASFRSLVTLTYHAASETWDDANRNLVVVKRSKADLNRFLTAMRPQLGAYLWVQEFQRRGVVHYHLLGERELFEPEVRLVWCRTIGALDDAAAWLYAAKVDVIRSEEAVRKYLAHYLGKGRQKRLPMGIDGACRWWGASRSVRLQVLREVVSWRKGEPRGNAAETRIVRTWRRFVSRLMGFKYKGGRIVDWKGEVSGRALRAAEELCAHYGESMTELLARHGWERKPKP